MSKVAIFIRTSNQHFCLGGLVFEWKAPAFEYLNERTRTTIALIRPQKYKQGVAFRLLGYDKVSDLKPSDLDTKTKGNSKSQSGLRGKQ